MLVKGVLIDNKIICIIRELYTNQAQIKSEFETRSGEVYSIQHYVIKFVCDLRQVGGFFPCSPVSSTNKTDRHDISEILLKVALNTIAITQTQIRIVIWLKQ
jgi:hypothetical protein